MVHGYQAANQLLRDPTFRVLDSHQMDQMQRPWREHPVQAALMRSMFFNNAPDHSRLRKLFSQAYTPARVKALTPQIIRTAQEHLDRMAELGADGSPVDFIAEFAIKVPGDVISEMMGVPVADRAWFLPRAQAFGDALELGISPPHVLEAGDRAAIELAEFFTDLVALRRKDPQDDIVTELSRLYAECGFDDEELMAGLITFFNAGFISTTHLLGNGLALLLDHPSTAAALAAEPDLAEGYVEEILRHGAPTHFVVRLSTEEREIAGTTIPAGVSVLVLLAAANRDPSQFENPDGFDPFRTNIRPLTFGAGPHYCLVHALSRLEGQLALPMLLQRFPDMTLAERRPMQARYTLRGYDTLPVKLG
jgi:cytochrome P450